MSGMRKLARGMAMAASRRKEGNTSGFKEEFYRIWRLEGGHPEYSHKDYATKTRMTGGIRRGRRRHPIDRALGHADR